MTKKKLMWVGDAGVPSGFARATHETLRALLQVYDVHVLALNYQGDPHPYPYPLYTVFRGGDWAGQGRLPVLCEKGPSNAKDWTRPDVIIIQQDGWNIPGYINKLRARKKNGEYYFPEVAGIPVIATLAVDGKNFRGEWLDGVSHANFWTEFALAEAVKGGYKGSATVIPLGVDLQTYYPMNKTEARTRRGFTAQYLDKFIVGNVNRNQPRKRWDLTIRYFAEWIRRGGIDDAYLMLHAAPTGDMDIDVVQLVKYYGIQERVIVIENAIFEGVSEQSMRETYNCFDVAMSTTQGEGFGLTVLEAMACGVPCIVPDWAALGEWAKRGAWLVPCTSTAIGPPYVNVIGGVPDEGKFIEALNALYHNKGFRERNSKAALECARQAQFNWDNIGQHFTRVVDGVLAEMTVV